MAVRTLRKQILGLALLLSWAFSFHASAITTEQAHQVMRQHYPELLGHGADLVSLYYFGAYPDSSSAFAPHGIYSEHTITVIGLERVGDDYLPVRWLLVFEDEQLLGWYHPVTEFPMAFKAGELVFPVGVKAPQVRLVPQPPSELSMGERTIPFIAHPNQESPEPARPESAGHVETVTP